MPLPTPCSDPRPSTEKPKPMGLGSPSRRPAELRNRSAFSGTRRGLSIRILLITAALVATLAAAIFAVVAGTTPRGNHDDSLDRLGKAPSWTLTDASGAVFSSEQLEGKPYAVVFFFLQCKGVCPGMLQQLKQLNDAAIAHPEALPGFRLVAISVDGTRDTPEALAAYQQSAALDPDVTRLLTGDDSTTWGISNDGFGFAAGPNLGQNGEPIPGVEFLHADSFVLVDGAGEIRGRYKYSLPSEMQQLLDDATALSR